MSKEIGNIKLRDSLETNSKHHATDKGFWFMILVLVPMIFILSYIGHKQGANNPPPPDTLYVKIINNEFRGE